LIAFPATAVGQDWSAALECADCHIPVGEDLQPFVVATWMQSDHANSAHGFNQTNRCAECHSPRDADPNDPGGAIPLDEWQAVTCYACHLPRALYVAIDEETRQGNFIVGSGDTPNSILPSINGEWDLVYHGDEDQLCMYCHTGPRHPGDQEFASFGKVMSEHKGVRCMDCHMPQLPLTLSDGTIRMSRTHEFTIDPDDAGFVRYSCGTDGAGCHAVHKTEWAVKQIKKGKIHGKEKD
jgi:hypothetical protein